MRVLRALPWFSACGILLWASSVFAQERRPLPAPDAPGSAASRRLDDGSFLLASGTRIPLRVMTSISTRNAAPGDQVYLQTILPVVVGGSVAVPAGAYVIGQVTESVRAGKVKGRGQLAVRFTTLQFEDGRSMDLTGRLGALDGDNRAMLDRREGKATSESGAGRDAMMTGGTAAAGAWVGAIADGGRGAGIGAGAGAAVGAAAMLLTRGPEVQLPRGSTVEIVLQQDVRVPPGR